MQLPGEERRGPAHEFVLLFQQPELLLCFPQLVRFLLGDTGTDAVFIFDVGFLQSVVQSCFGNPKFLCDLPQRGFMFPGDRNDIAGDCPGDCPRRLPPATAGCAARGNARCRTFWGLTRNGSTEVFNAGKVVEEFFVPTQVGNPPAKFAR